MVPPSSHRVSRVRRYSGYSWLSLLFVYGALTLYDAPSHVLQLRINIPFAVQTPDVLLLLVWPPPRSLATTGGISVDFSSSPYLDVSVQAVSLIYLWIQYMMYGMLHTDFSIRKSADQWIFAPPRSLSQLITSFIASESQGIRHAPLLSFFIIEHLRVG